MNYQPDIERPYQVPKKQRRLALAAVALEGKSEVVGKTSSPIAEKLPRYRRKKFKEPKF